MKLLTTNRLNKILKVNNVTSRYFLGTFPACNYPISKKDVYSFITNTDEHNQPGEHWNSWFVRGSKIIFFDSFGRPPHHQAFPQHYRDLIKNFNTVEYSLTQIQGLDAATCGLYCVHCIYVLSLGLDLNNFINDYYNDFKRNDKVVYDIVNSIL